MNACWIFGCALALTTISYISWYASLQRKKMREYWQNFIIQISLDIGGVLFAIGLAGTTQILWQRILWVILALGFVIQIVNETISIKNKKETHTQNSQ